jgi:hypothetical protein
MIGQGTGEQPDEEARRAGRRDALKKIGMGAGVAWSAPVAMSFFERASAASGSPAPTSTTSTSLPPPVEDCLGATCETFVPCTSLNPDCICVTTPDGPFCVPGSTPCTAGPQCGAGNTCPPGYLCAVDTCCGVPVCAPISIINECPPDPGGGANAGKARRVKTGANTFGG